MSAFLHPFALIAVVGLFGHTVGAAPPTRDDQPLRVVQPFAGNFPEALLAEGITSGLVRAILLIDAEGRLRDHLILAFTRRELVTELQAGLREWEFHPPRIRGEAVATRAEIVFSFESRGAVLSLNALAATTAATRWMGDEVISVAARAHELDHPLAILEAPAPVNPGPALRPPQATGSATVDFFVDADGRARVPAVADATHAAFGAAAVDAVALWRFTPPKRAGQPVVVRVRQQFHFRAGGLQSAGTD